MSERITLPIAVSEKYEQSVKKFLANEANKNRLLGYKGGQPIYGEVTHPDEFEQLLLKGDKMNSKAYTVPVGINIRRHRPWTLPKLAKIERVRFNEDFTEVISVPNLGMQVPEFTLGSLKLGEELQAFMYYNDNFIPLYKGWKCRSAYFGPNPDDDIIYKFVCPIAGTVNVMNDNDVEGRNYVLYLRITKRKSVAETIDVDYFFMKLNGMEVPADVEEAYKNAVNEDKSE